MIRADFHCHTRYSQDSFAPVAAVLDMAKRHGLTHLAITDHDSIEGALRARDRARGIEIIVGCEVTLASGAHVIGLFLERQPRTIDDIRAQGGFVYLPHPFQPYTGVLIDDVDAVEVCNGYEPPERNQQALDLARSRKLPALAGSDAHYVADVGRACVEFPAGPLTPAILRLSPRKLFGPVEDLSGLHLADARFRAETAPRLRQAVPKPLRKLAKRANWLRFQRQIAKLCREPLRKEIPL